MFIHLPKLTIASIIHISIIRIHSINIKYKLKQPVEGNISYICLR